MPIQLDSNVNFTWRILCWLRFLLFKKIENLLLIEKAKKNFFFTSLWTNQANFNCSEYNAIDPLDDKNHAANIFTQE